MSELRLDGAAPQDPELRELAAGSSGDARLPAPRTARGSSPPPIPRGDREAAKSSESRAASEPHPRDDDTEFAPPPHAAAMDEVVIAAGPVGDADDGTAKLDGPVQASWSGNPVVDIPVGRARPGRRARIRRRVTVPRRAGLTGDIRYVFAAITGARRARRELREARAELEHMRAAKAGELGALARRVVATLDIDVELVSEARERLSRLEDRRAAHAGRIAAADEELATIERRRASELEELRGRRRSLDARLASVRERLGPLTRRGAQALERAGELELGAEAAERRVALSERKLYWIHSPKLASVVEAGLRDHRAELEAIENEQIEVAAELDQVEPAIASLQSARADLCEKLEALDRAEEELEVRTAERLEAMRAMRRVDERSVSEADRERDEVLTQLAEAIVAERPAELADELAPLDARDVAIATAERRIFEQTELIAGIDRRAVARGAALLAIALLAALAAVLAIA